MKFTQMIMTHDTDIRHTNNPIANPLAIPFCDYNVLIPSLILHPYGEEKNDAMS